MVFIIYGSCCSFWAGDQGKSCSPVRSGLTVAGISLVAHAPNSICAAALTKGQRGIWFLPTEAKKQKKNVCVSVRVWVEGVATFLYLGRNQQNVAIWFGISDRLYIMYMIKENAPASFLFLLLERIIHYFGTRIIRRVKHSAWVFSLSLSEQGIDLTV